MIMFADVISMVFALYGAEPVPRDATVFAQAIAYAVNHDPAPAGVKRIEAAAWLVVTGKEEGGFRIRARRGDHGRSVCAFQVMSMSPRRRRLLERSPFACVRAAYAAIRASVEACPSAPLAQYAGGCGRRKAREISARRVELALFL